MWPIINLYKNENFFPSTSLPKARLTDLFAYFRLSFSQLCYFFFHYSTTSRLIFDPPPQFSSCFNSSSNSWLHTHLPPPTFFLSFNMYCILLCSFPRPFILPFALPCSHLFALQMLLLGTVHNKPFSVFSRAWIYPGLSFFKEKERASLVPSSLSVITMQSQE